jgi:hypothetical protein
MIVRLIEKIVTINQCWDTAVDYPRDTLNYVETTAIFNLFLPYNNLMDTTKLFYCDTKL